MKILLLMLFTFPALLLCAESKVPARSGGNFVACWVDRTTGRYALAVDMSFGEYPPQGQVSFGKIGGLKAYLSMDGGNMSKVDFLTILNGSPHGTMRGRCRPLNGKEAEQLLRERKHWKVVAN